MHRVVILQEYIPAYRVPFFDALRNRGLENDIDIRVAYGRASGRQALRADSMDLSYGLPVQQREYRLLAKRLVVRKVSNAVRGADLVILEQARRNIDSYAFLRPLRPKKPSIALWGHGTDYTRASGRISQTAMRWLTARADWFFAYTEGGAAAVRNMGFPEKRTTVVQNTIDTSALREEISSLSRSRIRAFAEQQHLKNMTALFLGALDNSKRLPFLLEAAEKAYALDDRFRLLIAGTGELRDEVVSWAGARSWATYLGPLNGTDKAVALSSVQVIVIPGRVGLVAVDSFASGKPIVTVDWPWHAPEFEYLEDGVTARVTENEPEIYARELIDLLSNGALLSKLSAACVAAERTYSLDHMVEKFFGGIRGALAVDQT